MQRRDQRTRKRQVVVEHFGFIDKHIRTRSCEALIMNGIGARIICRNLQCERNGLCRIADVFIECVTGFGRRGEAKRTVSMEIKLLGGGLFRRPGIKTTPLSGTGFENVSLRRDVIGVVLEEAAEERELDFFAVKLRSLCVEIDVAKLIAI